MMERRSFLVVAAGVLAGLTGRGGRAAQAQSAGGGMKSKVALVKGTDRPAGVRRAVELLEVNPVRGKKVLLKPNFNTADPFPASTHVDTLTHLIQALQQMGAAEITIGERSGPPSTASVLREKGIPQLARDLGVGLINFEELPAEGWVRIKPQGTHWRDGFDVAKPVLDAQAVVSTCCLKTHGFGGVFTLSLKLSVGITNKKNMRELHSSSVDMRRMIAEINQAYTPGLILLDGMEAFTDGGPATGTLKHAGVMVAGTDRVAVDAVGVAILKVLGSNRQIMDRPIFQQEQIARAVELGLGVSRPEDIEFVTDDGASREYADRLSTLLRTQGV